MMNRPVGTTGERLLRQAADDAGMVMVDWQSNAEVCAAKRLVARGLLYKQRFGGGRGQRALIVYVITLAGRAMLERFLPPLAEVQNNPVDILTRSSVD